MSEASKPDAEGKISKHDPVIVAHHQSAQMYFCPQTEELILLSDSEAGPFEQHWRDMLTRMDDYHQANGQYSTALERYATAYTKGDQPAAEVQKRLQAVTAAEKELETQRQKLREKLGEFSTSGMAYADVVELLPILDTQKQVKEKNKRGKTVIREVGRRYVYVKKSYFDDGHKQHKHHRVSLKSKDKKGATESIYGKDKHGRVRIDTDKLAKQLKKLEWPKIKLELKDVARWAGMEEQFKKLNQEGSVEGSVFGIQLFDWAKTWNDSLSTQKSVDDVMRYMDVDVSAGAQFMRYATNVGASVEFDPNKGQFAVKGEAKASLSIAAGAARFAAYIPDRLGTSLPFKNAGGSTFDLGMVRLCIDAQLTGFVGASIQAEGQLQVVRQGDRQLLAGQPGGRLPRFNERRLNEKKPFHQQMEAQDEGLQVSAEVFAGAKAEASLKGSVQWLKPTQPIDEKAPLASFLKSSGDFVDFATIGTNIAGLAGAGAGFKFRCTFINGKFCFHFAASLCWGVGAKGGLIAEVGVANIAEFGGWLIYQLYRLDYSVLEIVAKDAFMTYSRYCVMRFDEIEGELYGHYNKSKYSADNIRDYFLTFSESISDVSKRNIDASRRRNKLAKNTIAHQQELLHSTPESKGILLYLLTRHGIWDHLDSDNLGSGLVRDIYQDRKEAVICVLKSIQTRMEWNKVLCRMTRDGSSLVRGGDEAATVSRQRLQLVEFLQEGFNRDQDLRKAEQELAAVYDRIRTEIAWGYALAMNDTPYYQLNIGSNPHYPKRCTFGPCEAEESMWLTQREV